MQIGDRTIRTACPPADVYVIAEIGVNHDGDADRALALADAAADAGADAIKLQYFRAADLLSREALLAAYQQRAGETDPLAMLERLELDLGAMSRIIDHARTRGLHAIVTPFSMEHVADVAALAWDAIKIASPDVINAPLIDAVLQTARPVIISTGAATPGEVAQARGWVDAAADRVAFMHCVSSYPTAPKHAEIAAIAHVADITSLPVGYSDHTALVETGAVATARVGAALLEKHLTDDRTRPGPDHAASLEPDAFAAYARLARAGATSGIDEALVAALLGDGTKRVGDDEADVRTKSRQSVCAARDLTPGQAIDRKDLTVRRPGTGIAPARLGELIGRRVERPVPAGTLVRPADLVAFDISPAEDAA